MASLPRIYLALPERRIVLCLTPKVASSAIITAVLEHNGLPSDGVLHLNPDLPFIHRDAMQGLAGWRRAMFVRNPFDRLVANYQFHIVRTKLANCANMRRLGFHTGYTFEDFAGRATEDPGCDPHLALQCRQFDDDAAHFVGRIEALDEDWTAFRAFADLDLPDLKVVNATDRGGRGYREFYTDAWRERVAAAYADDLAAFDYGF